MPQKKAIRDLMSEIAAAETPRRVYDVALRCLQSTLNVERASMLLLDERQCMRFVASSGLSDAYRRAVDGHSPWSPNDADPEVVLVENVRESPALAALQAVLSAERIEACAFIPLRFQSRLLGKFMLYYDAPHVFSQDEVTLAEIVAGHVAFALEHRRVAAELEDRLASEREARERAELEAALREESERRLRLALSAGSMGAWEWDPATNRVDWSEELERIHGLEPKSFPGTLEAVERDVHPQDRERFRREVARALDGGAEEYEIEYRILPPDGLQRWVAANGRAIRDASGKAVRMTGICRDVSARKRVEERERFLAEAGRVLATTLEPDSAVRQLARIVVPHLADWCAIQVVDEHGRLNPVEIAHRDPDNVALGWKLMRRPRKRPHPAGSAEAVLESRLPALVAHVSPEMIAQAAEDDEHHEALTRLGLRSIITVPLQARGGVLGVLSVGTAESGRTYGEEDMRAVEEIASWAALALDNAKLLAEAENAWTAAERARRRLQVLAELTEDLASELEPAAALQRLAQKVVESMADYCVTYSYDGSSIAREGFAHRLAEKNELVRRLADSGPPGLDDAIGVGAAIRSGTPTLAAGLTPERIQETALHPEHKKAVLALQPRSAMIVPLRSRGRPVGAITFATTADSERQYDSSDVDLAVELANRVALFIDNAQLYAEAKAAVAARDEMIRVVSHDLRNPLQSIATAAALLERGGPPERRERTLETISLATTQMKRLLQDLLDMSQMEAGQFSVAAERVDSAALIREAHTLFVSVAEEKKIRLEWRTAAAVPIRADYGRIMQVLSNLISNALKFVPAGGTVVLGVDRHGSRVRFSISDTGIGLSAEDQARVFDRFWRGDRRKDRGAGLGLALAKGIIEAHGGEIGVESVLGRGSTFYFILDADVADDALAPGLMGGSTIRILDGQDGLGEAIPDMASWGATKPH